MSAAAILNKLFERFGATRVQVVHCDQLGCDVVIGNRQYSICRLRDWLTVEEYMEGDVTDVTPGSEWIEGILRGKTRDDAGVLQ